MAIHVIKVRRVGAKATRRKKKAKRKTASGRLMHGKGRMAGGRGRIMRGKGKYGLKFDEIASNFAKLGSAVFKARRPKKTGLFANIKLKRKVGDNHGKYGPKKPGSKSKWGKIFGNQVMKC